MKETGILRNNKIMKNDRIIYTVCHIIRVEWSLIMNVYKMQPYVADGIGRRLTTDQLWAEFIEEKVCAS